MTAVLVLLGGAGGAVLRYLIDRRVQRSHASVFPWGTWVANVLGSGLLGLLAGWTLAGSEPGAAGALIGVGLCGSLSTFSTFGYETVQLLIGRARLYAVANVVMTVLSGFGAAAAGLALASALWA